MRKKVNKKQKKKNLLIRMARKKKKNQKEKIKYHHLKHFNLNFIISRLDDFINRKYALEVDKLQIQKGQFVSVIGRVGSGKSTLLSAILN
jgi:ABC-type bacteriocin/lantibiotic exporter with double-glycine peptidase domain